jgi:hypothetical protein
MKYRTRFGAHGPVTTATAIYVCPRIFAKNSRIREPREFWFVESSHFQWLTNGGRIAFPLNVMLKIQRSQNGRVVFRLSGRIEAEDVAELRRLFALETTGRQLVLDLQDVTIVDRDAVKFLAHCEAENIKIENCPPYVREWIGRESGQKRRQKQ